MAERLRLGQLLIDAGIVMPEELEVVLLRQKKDGRKLGSLLVDAGLVNETQLTQILSQQLNAPWVSLYHIDFSRQLLNLVPRAVVEQFCLVPIYVRHVRGQGETLYVAMDDPTNEEALDACRASSGLPVRAMIAPPSDIRNAIRVYYRGGRESEPSLEAVAAARAPDAPEPMLPDESSPPRAPLPSEPIPLVQRAAGAPPSVVEVGDDAPVAIDRPTRTPSVPAPPAARQELRSVPVVFDDEGPAVLPHEIPQPKPERTKKAMPRMLSLTLLDGTTLSLPAARRRSPKAPSVPPPPSAAAEPQGAEGLSEDDEIPEDGLFTARDIVAALRAACHGADAKDILGESARWEALVAALLSVLLRKHLIADWEFVEEYKKI